MNPAPLQVTGRRSAGLHRQTLCRKLRRDRQALPRVFSRRAPMNRASSSPVLRTPSPPLGAEERDGERRFMGRKAMDTQTSLNGSANHGPALRMLFARFLVMAALSAALDDVST